jgi:hypothetical protein
VKDKTKFNLIALCSALGLLVPVFTVFDRTYASQYMGEAIGLGLGLLFYAPTGLPFLAYSWLTRKWHALHASLIAAFLYLPFLLYMWRGLSYLGDDIDYVREIIGTIYATTVGILLLQLLMTSISFAFNKMRGRST